MGQEKGEGSLERVEVKHGRREESGWLFSALLRAVVQCSDWVWNQTMRAQIPAVPFANYVVLQNLLNPISSISVSLKRVEWQYLLSGGFNKVIHVRCLAQFPALKKMHSKCLTLLIFNWSLLPASTTNAICELPMESVKHLRVHWCSGRESPVNRYTCVFCLKEISPLFPVAISSDPLREGRVGCKKTWSLVMPGARRAEQMYPSSTPCFPSFTPILRWCHAEEGALGKCKSMQPLQRAKCSNNSQIFKYTSPWPQILASVIFIFTDMLTYVLNDLSVRLFTTQQKLETI